jgi:ribosomal protein S18 acetylase RimI-like enzyme
MYDVATSILEVCGGPRFDGYWLGGERPLIVLPASVHNDGVIGLLAVAVGNHPQRISQTVQRYRDDPATILLVAAVDRDPVGVVGYVVDDDNVVVLHIATKAVSRRTGVGRRMLSAVREATPRHLPIVAETDVGALDFYRANGFIAESLGVTHPGGERFIVRSAATDPATPRI